MVLSFCYMIFITLWALYINVDPTIEWLGGKKASTPFTGCQSFIVAICFTNCLLERLHSSCCLINRMPSVVINNLSSFEKLYGRRPNYASLKYFGCLCFANTLSANRNEFDPRAVKCLFLGYPFGTKGYNYLIYPMEKFLFLEM